MALIIPSQIGELSGRLGGSVYARNQFGYYVRNYVAGVNPNSSEQNSARSRFSTIAGAFNVVADEYKPLWQEFAQNVWQKLRESRSGGRAGYNAFVGTNCVISNVATNKQSFTLLSEQGVDPFARTEINMNFLNTEPQNLRLTPNFSTYQGGSVPISLASAEFNQDGTWRFRIEWSEFPTLYNVAENIDVNGNYLGYMLYISNQKTEKDNFFEHDYYRVGAIINPFSGPDTDVPANYSSFWECYSNIPQDVSGYHDWYIVGRWVRATLVIVNQWGQQKKVGSKVIQIG